MSDEKQIRAALPGGNNKIADRPHWISIATAFLGPAVAIVAVIIATRSLRLSQQALTLNERSLKVAQRAYVAISGGKATLGPVLDDPERQASGSHFAQLTYVLDITNLGNTPGAVSQYCVQFDAAQGWQGETLPTPDSPSPHAVAEICSAGPGDVPRAATVNGDLNVINFRLTGPAWNSYRAEQARVAEMLRQGFVTSSNVGWVRMRGRLDYSDVFGDLHQIQWCWVAHEMATYPAVCGPDPQR